MNETMRKAQFYVDLILMIVSFLSAITLVWLMLLGIVLFGWGSGLSLALFIFLAMIASPSEGHKKTPVSGGKDDKPIS